MPDSISTEANVLRCGFEVGYFDKPDIARWADRWILTLEEPCDELFDLSLNRRLDPIDIESLFRKLSSPEPDLPVQTRFGFIGLLYDEKKTSAQYVARQLFLSVHQPGITREEASRIYYLDDGCDLAYSGQYGTVDQINRELGEFLSPYAKQLVSQYPQFFPHT